MHDLNDVTFVIPFALDSEDRLRNLKISTEYLLTHFQTNIVISEYADRSRLSLDQWSPAMTRNIRHEFFPNSNPYFQRTRSVNLAVKTITTPYFVIYDSDVLLKTGQYLQAAALLRSRKADMVLPFANQVMWIPEQEVNMLPRRISDTTLASLEYVLSDDSYIFLGLVNFINRQSFLNAGMMNEKFRAWGFEEMELYMRLVKLGYSVLRTPGLAYHLDHYRGAGSNAEHDYYQANQQEYHRILALNPDEMRGYIRTWNWVEEDESERKGA
jgi:predicted glycosyltransferase involved in capsule biosynthesis